MASSDFALLFPLTSPAFRSGQLTVSILQTIAFNLFFAIFTFFVFFLVKGGILLCKAAWHGRCFEAFWS